MQHAWVFYDGSCGLCHRSVRFAVTRDRDGSRFRFAPLGGVSAGRELRATGASLPDSIVVLTPRREVLFRSDGVVYIFKSIGGVWATIGSVLAIVPRPLRDAGYRAIAKLRRRLFAPPGGVCPVVPADLRARFEP